MAFNASYPFTLTTLGQSLGFKGWHDANKLLETVKNITGIDIKTFDNKYHYAIMNGDEIQSLDILTIFVNSLRKFEMVRSLI